MLLGIVMLCGAKQPTIPASSKPKPPVLMDTAVAKLSPEIEEAIRNLTSLK
jgi:hypothetical protein